MDTLDLSIGLIVVAFYRPLHQILVLLVAKDSVSALPVVSAGFNPELLSKDHASDMASELTSVPADDQSGPVGISVVSESRIVVASGVDPNIENHA